MKWFVSVLAVLLLQGCGCVDKSSFLFDENKNDPNEGMLVEASFEGKPASVVAETTVEVWAENERSAKGRENALFNTVKKTAIPLVALFVGGLIFWGITRSKQGWIIPAAALAGLILVISMAQVAKYIVWGMVGISVLVLIWKAYEYQKERNISLEEVKRLKER